MKADVCIADICLPDFWSGHHKPHLMVAVHNGMTLAAVRRQLRDEVRMGAVMGSDEHARLLTADYLPDSADAKKADKLVKAVYAGINRVKGVDKGQRTLKNVRAEGHGDDDVYAYFVIQVEE